MSINGATQSTEKKLQFRPRTSSAELQPDAPEGEWEARIPRGKCKVLTTQAGDPRIIIPFKLEKAADEKNEGHQGSEVQLSIIFFDDNDAEKRRGANMMKGKLRALCDACELDFGEVYPTEITETADFDPLFQALEGKQMTVWTVHTTRKAQSGEDVTDTEVRFRKPGAGLVTKGVDDDNEERPSKKAAAGKKLARR